MFAPVNWQGGDGGEGASRKSNRRSLLVDYGAPETTLPIPDYFSHEVFRMVMNSPSAAHALLRYAQSKGAGENMAYLLKVSCTKASEQRDSALSSCLHSQPEVGGAGRALVELTLKLPVLCDKSKGKIHKNAKGLSHAHTSSLS